MKIAWLGNLKQHVEKKPIVILRFNEDEWVRLGKSRQGFNEFTVARSHEVLKGVKSSTPCLIISEGDNSENLYFGLISSKSAVTTLESRIKIRHGMKIQPRSESELISLVKNKHYANFLKNRLSGNESVVLLSSKLSSHLIEMLATIGSNERAMRVVADSLNSPKSFQSQAAFQEDALRAAFKAFGLTSNDRALSLDLVKGRETALARIEIMEDSVIEHDARSIRGYDLVGSDLTGRAIFERNKERLVVFTANRRPLERVFGVDLIYLNESKQNIVMLQYKMLEPYQIEDFDDDWIYRPDTRLDKEIGRMKKFASTHTMGPHEYRLNPAVFYLKFVKRDSPISSASIIVPIEHFEKLRTDPTCRGPRNGIRVSYQSLSGRYLRQNAFIDLIRSGYIGAHAEKTTHLKTLIEAVLNNGRAVVAAIQQPIENGTTADDNLDFVEKSISDI